MKSVGFRTCTFISFFIFFRLKYKLLMLKSYRERCTIVSQAEFLPVSDIFVLGIS